MAVAYRARMLYTFPGDPSDAEQLAVGEGETVSVLEDYPDGWSQCRDESSRRQGIVPTSYFERIPSALKPQQPPPPQPQQSQSSSSNGSANPLEKYERMKRAGLSEGAIRNAMQRDGVPVDANFFAAPQPVPSSSAPSFSQGQSGGQSGSAFAGPEYEKYNRMRKAGLPEGAIENAMRRDGVTVPTGFFDSDMSGEEVGGRTEAGGDSSGGAGTAVEVPGFEKYYRMQKAGLPEGAILNAMKRDGVEPPAGFFGASAPVPAVAKVPSKAAPQQGSQPGGFLAGIKQFDKNNLHKSPKKEERQANPNRSTSSAGGGGGGGNGLLAGIQGFNRSKLKHGANGAETKKSAPAPAPAGNSLMAQIQARALKRQQRAAAEGGPANQSKPVNITAIPSKPLRKVSESKSKYTPKPSPKPEWMKKQLRKTSEGAHAKGPDVTAMAKKLPPPVVAESSVKYYQSQQGKTHAMQKSPPPTRSVQRSPALPEKPASLKSMPPPRTAPQLPPTQSPQKVPPPPPSKPQQQPTPQRVPSHIPQTTRVQSQPKHVPPPPPAKVPPPPPSKTATSRQPVSTQPPPPPPPAKSPPPPPPAIGKMPTAAAAAVRRGRRRRPKAPSLVPPPPPARAPTRQAPTRAPPTRSAPNPHVPLPPPKNPPPPPPRAAPGRVVTR